MCAAALVRYETHSIMAVRAVQHQRVLAVRSRVPTRSDGDVIKCVGTFHDGMVDVNMPANAHHTACAPCGNHCGPDFTPHYLVQVPFPLCEPETAACNGLRSVRR